MKKVRIMLMSIAIVAVVAGALAFKASEKFNVNYCTTTVGTGLTCTDEGVFCDFLDDDIVTIDPLINVRPVCITTVDENGECPQNHPCQEETITIGDETAQ